MPLPPWPNRHLLVCWNWLEVLYHHLLCLTIAGCRTGTDSCGRCVHTVHGTVPPPVGWTAVIRHWYRVTMTICLPTDTGRAGLACQLPHFAPGAMPAPVCHLPPARCCACPAPPAMPAMDAHVLLALPHLPPLRFTWTTQHPHTTPALHTHHPYPPPTTAPLLRTTPRTVPALYTAHYLATYPVDLPHPPPRLYLPPRLAVCRSVSLCAPFIPLPPVPCSILTQFFPFARSPTPICCFALLRVYCTPRGSHIAATRGSAVTLPAHTTRSWIRFGTFPHGPATPSPHPTRYATLPIWALPFSLPACDGYCPVPLPSRYHTFGSTVPSQFVLPRFPLPLHTYIWFHVTPFAFIHCLALRLRFTGSIAPTPLHLFVPRGWACRATRIYYCLHTALRAVAILLPHTPSIVPHTPLPRIAPTLPLPPPCCWLDAPLTLLVGRWLPVTFAVSRTFLPCLYLPPRHIPHLTTYITVRLPPSHTATRIPFLTHTHTRCPTYGCRTRRCAHTAALHLGFTRRAFPHGRCTCRFLPYPPLLPLVPVLPYLVLPRCCTPLVAHAAYTQHTQVLYCYWLLYGLLPIATTFTVLLHACLPFTPAAAARYATLATAHALHQPCAPTYLPHVPFEHGSYGSAYHHLPRCRTPCGCWLLIVAGLHLHLALLRRFTSARWVAILPGLPQDRCATFYSVAAVCSRVTAFAACDDLTCTIRFIRLPAVAQHRVPRITSSGTARLPWTLRNGPLVWTPSDCASPPPTAFY